MAAVIGRGIKKGLNGIGGKNIQLGEVYDENVQFRGPLNSTFAPYYIVVVSMNSVAILAGIFSQFDFHYNQRYTRFDRMDTWYLTNAVFAILHILAAVYIVHKIEQPNNPNVRSTGDAENPAFDYNQLHGTVNTPPPPMNPNYIQAHEVVVVPMDRIKNTTSFPHAPPRVPAKVITEPLTWARIKYVLSEDEFVAIYILIFAMYMAWHYFMDFSHINYYAYPAIQLVMRCADIFVVAGPASLLFSIVYTLVTKAND
uniref:Uncharacterized protein n=1 Tax=Amphora coffeiformis TaxID=265554 RepID=A0A7S3L7Q2_9STRA|mmetsp:Transcript_4642/g.8833  ORF Transcript_4642/g.8833 Transcript_4642/m.8833 type:complete len:256 (+) Transcript_4642:74-841(+)|eukprot:scaffold710_cov171-Amphora_coffeaeformis.AAC.60